VIYSVKIVINIYLDESEEDEAAPPLSKRRRAAERREPIEEVNILKL